MEVYNNSIIDMTDSANMNSPKEEPGSNASNRWYDRDPVLQKAIRQLRQATDRQQAQVALNIIKIIVEHQIEAETSMVLEELDNILPYHRSSEDHQSHRRWYDVHETLGSAIQLLGDCPDDLQACLIPSIAQMIEKTLQSPD